MALDSLASGKYDFAISMNEPHLNRAFYLPRLPREYYQGDAVVHWSLPISHRRQGWLDERFHATFRELLLHAAAREGLFCPTYCLMPDHRHLVVEALCSGEARGRRENSSPANPVAVEAFNRPTSPVPP